MLATGIDASKLTGALSANVTGAGLQVFGTSNTVPSVTTSGATFTVAGVPFAPKALLMTAYPILNDVGSGTNFGFAIKNSSSSIVQYSGRRTVDELDSGWNFSNACCSVTQELFGQSTEADFVDITITAFNSNGGSFTILPLPSTGHAGGGIRCGIMWLG